MRRELKRLKRLDIKTPCKFTLDFLVEWKFI